MGESSVVTIEGDGRLSLVRDADADDLVTGRLGPLGDRPQGRHGQAGDLVSIVFDLARSREVLGELAIAGVDRARVVVEGDGAHPRGAGIEGEHELHLGEVSDGYRAVCG